MKYSTIVLAFAATAVSAQSIAALQATIPQCAQACLAAAVASSGCAPTDFTCQCGSGQAAIKSSATDCITKALGTPTGCSIPDALMVQPIADKICAAATAMPAVESTSAAPAPVAASSAPVAPISQTSDGQIQATTAAPKTASSSAAPYMAANGTYSTVYATSTFTILSCAPTVTACPVGKVTTQTVSLYTTFCPYSSSAAVVAPPASVAPPAQSAAKTTSVAVIPTTPAVVSPPAQTSVPAAAGGKNSTMITSGKASPTASKPATFTGAASGLRVGGVMGAVLAVAALAL